MSACEQYFNQIHRLRRRKLDDDERRQLFVHLAECGDCRELFDLQEDLVAVGAGHGDPDPDALAAMRGRVLDEIRRSSPNAAG